MENVKVCQSCGMHMDGEAEFGTNADGSQNDDYCSYCFTNGSFNDSNETVEEMVEECVPFLVKEGVFLDEDAARKYLQEQLPPLKRWKTA